jgi:hypothetical protein
MERILERNDQYFKQAEKTQFAVGPRASELKNMMVVEEVLNGVWTTEHTLREVEEFMKHLRRIEGLIPVDQTITVVKFQAAFKWVKERTSSSTSGRHGGHYKAAAKSQDASHIHASILSMSLKHGSTLHRWKNITYVMLLKKPGYVCLHRLRIVQLIEADFNQFLRITFARHHSEDSQWFHPSQYARSKRTCTSAVLLKVITY